MADWEYSGLRVVVAGAGRPVELPGQYVVHNYGGGKRKREVYEPLSSVQVGVVKDLMSLKTPYRLNEPKRWEAVMNRFDTAFNSKPPPYYALPAGPYLASGGFYKNLPYALRSPSWR